MSENRVYHKIQDKALWEVWCQRPTRSRQKVYYQSATTEANCPASSVPVSVVHRGQDIAVSGMGDTVQVGTLPRAPMEQDRIATSRVETLRRILQEVHPSLQWAIEELELPVDGGKAIATKIKKRRRRLY